MPAAVDRRARDELILTNERLVHSRVRKLTRGVVLSDEEYRDLVSDATEGLIHAVNGFDPSKGFKFSTYAVYWIDGALKRRFDKDRKRDLPVELADVDETGAPVEKVKDNE